MAGEAVLLVGDGGREHAIAEAIGASPNPPDILYYARSNVGIDDMRGGPMNIVNVDCAPTDINGVLRFVDEKIQDPSNLTVVVGPEAPLIAGLGNKLRERGLAVFGPNAEAAQLEASKVISTKFLQQYVIPHPNTTIVESPEDALKALSQLNPEDVVLKSDRAEASRADGVVLPDSREEMMAAARAMLTGS